MIHERRSERPHPGARAATVKTFLAELRIIACREMGDCPACFEELSDESSVVLGVCGHVLCKPCAVAVVHVGMEAGRPFPQCLVCVDAGMPLTSSAEKYGPGWLSYEALYALQRWTESAEVASNMAVTLRGQQPISALLVNRYCQSS